MSDTMTAESLGITQEDFDRMPPGLREKARKADKLEHELAERDAQAASMAKENALLKAGIPLDTPFGEMFADGYKGEIDPEAMKAKWLEVSPQGGPGTLTPPAGTQDDASEAELERLRQLADAGAGGEGGGAKKFEDALAAAKNEDEVMRLVGSAPTAAGVCAPVIQ